MRRLVVLVLVLGIVVVAAVIGDTVARHRAETVIAARIEAAVPGTAAQVQISSFPFVGRLAVSGRVASVRARVTGATVGRFPVDLVDLVVNDLAVSRPDLLNGKVVVRFIASATATATLSQQSVDTGSGLPVTLGAGTVGLAGVQVPAQVSLVSGSVRISVPPLPTLTLPALPPVLLPCTADAVLTPGLLTLSCTTATVPTALITALGG